MRWATDRENSQNTSLSNRNSSGVKGVSYHKASKLWRSRITFNNREILIGYYKTLEEAKFARQKKAHEVFGDFANRVEKIRNEIEADLLRQLN